MRELSCMTLAILTTVLALWLALDFWPLSAGSQIALSVCILLICGAVLWRQWRLFRRGQATRGQTAESHLPPEDFQGAVVLVCGDTARLFPAETAYHETGQGWYLRVENAERLPLVAQRLASTRPALVSQVSVLLAFLPEQHMNDEALAHTLRGWRAVLCSAGAG